MKNKKKCESRTVLRNEKRFFISLFFFFFFAFAFCESNRLDYEFFNRVPFRPTRHVLDVLLEIFIFLKCLWFIFVFNVHSLRVTPLQYGPLGDAGILIN